MIGDNSWGIFVKSPTSIVMGLVIFLSLGRSIAPAIIKMFKARGEQL